MTIEVISMAITDRESGTVEVLGIDCSTLNYERMVNRDDGEAREVLFRWTTKDSRQFYAFRKWLKSQKALKNCKTYKEVFEEIVGLIVESPSYRYRVFEDM